MLPFRRLVASIVARRHRSTAARRAVTPSVLLAFVVLVTFDVPMLEAQAAAASGTPLHLAASHFDFVAAGDTTVLTKPLRVHNGGTAPFTDVRLTRLAYADSARGAAWLVAQPRQSGVAADELATVGLLCIDASGLPAGIYRATAAVGAREVAEPVPFTITLVVTDVGARTRPASGRCGGGGKE